MHLGLLYLKGGGRGAHPLRVALFHVTINSIMPLTDVTSVWHAMNHMKNDLRPIEKLQIEEHVQLRFYKKCKSF